MEALLPQIRGGSDSKGNMCKGPGAGGTLHSKEEGKSQKGWSLERTTHVKLGKHQCLLGIGSLCDWVMPGRYKKPLDLVPGASLDYRQMVTYLKCRKESLGSGRCFSG